MSVEANVFCRGQQIGKQVQKGVPCPKSYSQEVADFGFQGPVALTHAPWSQQPQGRDLYAKH